MMNKTISTFNTVVLLWHVVAMFLLLLACVIGPLPSGMQQTSMSEVIWFLVWSGGRRLLVPAVVGLGVTVALTWLLTIQLSLPNPRSRQLPIPVMMLTGILSAMFLTPDAPWMFPIAAIRALATMLVGTLPQFTWSKGSELVGASLGNWCILWFLLEIRAFKRNTSANKASDSTSEPAPNEGSSSPQG